MGTASSLTLAATIVWLEWFRNTCLLKGKWTIWTTHIICTAGLHGMFTLLSVHRKVLFERLDLHCVICFGTWLWPATLLTYVFIYIFIYVYIYEWIIQNYSTRSLLALPAGPARSPATTRLGHHSSESSLVNGADNWLPLDITSECCLQTPQMHLLLGCYCYELQAATTADSSLPWCR